MIYTLYNLNIMTISKFEMVKYVHYEVFHNEAKVPSKYAQKSNERN